MYIKLSTDYGLRERISVKIERQNQKKLNKTN